MARQTRAKASYVLMSPRKVRLVLELVRDKYVDDAVAILRGTPNRAARVLEKLVHSATANAENNMGLSRDGLKVSGGFADSGPTLKRIHPRAMGRAFRIIKRTSHITVIVEEAEVRQARRLARTVTKADSLRGRKPKAEKPKVEVTAPSAEVEEQVVAGVDSQVPLDEQIQATPEESVVTASVEPAEGAADIPEGSEESSSKESV